MQEKTKMEKQLLGSSTKIKKMAWAAIRSSHEESVVTDVRNEFRQDLKRRSQEAELIRNKQLENTKKRKERRKEEGKEHKINEKQRSGRQHKFFFSYKKISLIYIKLLF